MSIDPNIGKAFDALSALQSNLDKVADLKGGGELRAVDGKAQVVKKGFFGKIWSKLTRSKPDPVVNVTGLVAMQTECAKELLNIRAILTDDGAPDELKGQLRNTLKQVLQMYNPDSLKEYEGRMATQLEQSAKDANVNLGTLKQDFERGGLDEMPERFEGNTKTQIERFVSFMRIAGPAVRIESLPQVAVLMGSKTGSEVSKLNVLLSKAFEIATSKEPILNSESLRGVLADVGVENPVVAGAESPPVAGAPPPPPPPSMNPEQAQKLAAVKRKENEARLKAEAEAKRQAAIKGVKEEQKELKKDISKTTGVVKEMGEKTRAMQKKVKDLRKGIKRLESVAKSSDEFRLYESSLSGLEDAKARVKESAEELKTFKAEIGESASHLRKFLSGNQKSTNIPVVRGVQNPDTKEEEFVEQTVAIERAQAERLLKIEYETPLKELEDSHESAVVAHSKMEENIRNLENRAIGGKTYGTFVKTYHREKSAFEKLETDLKHLNAEKFAVQDSIVAKNKALNELEVKLAKLEKRTPEVKTVAKKVFDPGEIQRRMREGAGPIHLRDINLKGKVKVQPPSDFENSENTGPSDNKKVGKPKSKGFLGRIFG